MNKVLIAVVVAVLSVGIAHSDEYLHGQSGTTYNNIGGTTFGSDGSSSNTIGDTTFGSDGSTSTRIGNSTFNSNGTDRPPV